MAKYIVRKNDVTLAEESADKVLSFFATFRDEVNEFLGLETGEKGNELAKSYLTVDPEKKKLLKSGAALLLSTFMADQSLSGVGREPIADIDALGVVFQEVRAVHPTMPVKKLVKWVASTYNMKYAAHNPEGQITPQYVTKYAKSKGWEDLPVVPSENAV